MFSRGRVIPNFTHSPYSKMSKFINHRPDSTEKQATNVVGGT